MKYFVLIGALLTFSACSTPKSQTPNAPPVPPAGQDTCNATRFAGLVGQDATALERILLMGQVRVIRPGHAVTADFRPERINFNINAAERIASIRCG